MVMVMGDLWGAFFCGRNSHISYFRSHHVSFFGKTFWPNLRCFEMSSSDGRLCWKSRSLFLNAFVVASASVCIPSRLVLPDEMRGVEMGFHQTNSEPHMHMHVGLPAYVQSVEEPGKWESQPAEKNIFIPVQRVASSRWNLNLEHESKLGEISSAVWKGEELTAEDIASWGWGDRPAEMEQESSAVPTPVVPSGSAGPGGSIRFPDGMPIGPPNAPVVVIPERGPTLSPHQAIIEYPMWESGLLAGTGTDVDKVERKTSLEKLVAELFSTIPAPKDGGSWLPHFNFGRIAKEPGAARKEGTEAPWMVFTREALDVLWKRQLKVFFVNMVYGVQDFKKSLFYTAELPIIRDKMWERFYQKQDPDGDQFDDETNSLIILNLNSEDSPCSCAEVVEMVENNQELPPSSVCCVDWPGPNLELEEKLNDSSRVELVRDTINWKKCNGVSISTVSVGYKLFQLDERSTVLRLFFDRLNPLGDLVAEGNLEKWLTSGHNRDQLQRVLVKWNRDTDEKFFSGLHKVFGFARSSGSGPFSELCNLFRRLEGLIASGSFEHVPLPSPLSISPHDKVLLKIKGHIAGLKHKQNAVEKAIGLILERNQGDASVDAYIEKQVI